MNFILGGMSSGLAVAAFLAWVLGGVPDAALPWFFAAAGVGMAVGLLFVFAEIGRPVRFLYVLRRPRTSWMTRETYAVAVFYPAVAADFLWPSPILHVLVAVAAAAFLFCQGRILHAGKGIPAWRHRLVPRMLIVSGLYEGVALLVLGLVLFLLGSGGIATEGSMLASESAGAGILVAAFAGALLAAANAKLFRTYRRGAAKAGIGGLSRRDLDAIAGWMRWMGHLVPLALFAATVIAAVLLLLSAAVFGLQCGTGGETSAGCVGLESRGHRRDAGGSPCAPRSGGVRACRGGAVEVHAHRPGLPPAGVRPATRSATGFRLTRRPGPLRPSLTIPRPASGLEASTPPVLERGRVTGRLLVLAAGFCMSLGGPIIRLADDITEWPFLFYRSLGRPCCCSRTSTSPAGRSSPSFGARARPVSWPASASRSRSSATCGGSCTPPSPTRSSS